MAKIRVLMVCKACVVGIYQRKLEYIARHDDIELMVVVPPSWRDERGEMPLERVYTDGYTLKVLPIRRNGDFHLFSFVGLREVVHDFKPHVVHIDEEPYNLAAWQALWHAKRAGAATLFFSWQNIARRYPPPFSWGEAWVLRAVDYALIGTQSALDVWRAKGYCKDAAVVPQFGTDPDLFAPSPRLPRPFTIGYIGRLVEEKGVFDLLHATAGLGGEWRLRWVGGGPLREPLYTEALRLSVAERMDFVGQVASTEMPRQYAALDVLVLPSRTRANWKEQFGRVLVEAMACGVPVIGSNSGAIPDVIGEAGLVFAEGDHQALRAHLESLRGDVTLREWLSQAGRARVLAHFTHQQVADATVDVYRCLHKTHR